MFSKWIYVKRLTLGLINVLLALRQWLKNCFGPETSFCWLKKFGAFFCCGPSSRPSLCAWVVGKQQGEMKFLSSCWRLLYQLFWHMAFRQCSIRHWGHPENHLWAHQWNWVMPPRGHITSGSQPWQPSLEFLGMDTEGIRVSPTIWASSGLWQEE